MSEEQKVVTDGDPSVDRREEIRKQHLLDENKLKIMNAEFLIKATKVNTDDPKQRHKHLNQIVLRCEQELESIGTVFSNDVTIIKEKMRNKFVSTTYEPGEERAISDLVLEILEEGVNEMVDEIEWARDHVKLIRKFRDEQIPESLSEKVGGWLTLPFRVPGKVFDKIRGK